MQSEKRSLQKIKNDYQKQEPVNMHFDDFTVYHGKTNVVQSDDYYPFGLQFNKYQRNSSVKNTMNTFQDQEYDEETGWVQFKWRNHMPEIGRFFNIDPLAELFYYNSPYAFSENKVTGHIELEGLEAVPFDSDLEGHGIETSKSVNRSNQTVTVSTNTTQNGTPVSTQETTIITLAGTVKQEHITDQTAEVISDNAEESGNESLTVTSAYRDADHQANVMYDNLESKGVESQKALYGPNGDKVIDAYSAAKIEGSCDLCTKSSMTNKINELGPGNVSKHSSDPNTYNVVDIAPSSLSNQDGFTISLSGDQRVKKVLSPRNSDPAVHIEIPQKIGN